MSTSAQSSAQAAERPAARLAARELTLGYGPEAVVHALDLDVPTDATTVIIGPNGCGKSTLLRAMARLMPARSGHVLLDGKRIDRTPTREVARILGILPQAPQAPDGLTVTDLVARGRHPHQTWYQQWSSDDADAVAQALAWTDLSGFADRTLDALSGGQRQRAWIAMALAQGTDLLLLDEPTTYLDLAHQIDVLDLVARLRREQGLTVVMVLHDLNLAARYADHLVAMRDGRIMRQGAPGEVLTVETVEAVFGLRSQVIPDPVAGTPLVVPIGRHQPAPQDPPGDRRS